MSMPRTSTRYLRSLMERLPAMLSASAAPPLSSAIFSAACWMYASSQREGSATMFHTTLLRASSAPVEL